MKPFLLACLACLACLALSNPAAGTDLAKGFATPPPEARPWVYWFWLNGNLTKKGMTADLEAMQRAGVGGVLIMEVDQGSPLGPVAFMSDQWRDLFKHAVTEAARLGLEINMNNDAGWNGSGGPWVPLDKAMQVVTTSEIQVPAGKPFDGKLPAPPARGFYQDIAVLAFPTPDEPDNPAHRIQDLAIKGMTWTPMYFNSLPDTLPDAIPAKFAVAKDQIVDLTKMMGPDGRLQWDAPPPPAAGSNNSWTVIRFGHTFTGANSHPAPASGAGPECDKLSKDGIEAHYRGMIGKLVQDNAALAGKAFTATHVDSWEVGSQNWTPRMRGEFLRLRGYDLLPFLPVLTGRVVAGTEISERFLRDLRQTISDLLVENYIGHLRTLAHRDGLRLSMESYCTPAHDSDVANRVDEPICEFWWPDGGGAYWSVKSMSSTAHVNGRTIIGAEAFTAGDHERWLAHPAVIKALGDKVFCDGVNRFIVHRYAMQPWTDKRWPGMTMGPWGLHYERSNTWWEQSKAWHEYVARCQYLLRQGLFVADVLSLQPEEPMQRFATLALSGYDYDGISPQAFLKDVTVENGRLKLPSGMSYRLLRLPNVTSMSPAMLAKIASLLEQGATVIGDPPARAPGLTDYPQSDAKVAAWVQKLWRDGVAAGGKPNRVLTDTTPAHVLEKSGVAADFTTDQPLRYIHRVADGRDIYFVASAAPQAVEARCTFRVAGKRPEAWFPDSGRIEPVSVFDEADGCTTIPLRFDPCGSLFVVFQPGTAKPAGRIISVRRNGAELIDRGSPGATTRALSRTFTITAWVKPEKPIGLPGESATGTEALGLQHNDVVYPAPGHEVWTARDAGAGLGVGTNGICVYEHGAAYFPAVLVHAAPIDHWTHVALVYQNGSPSLYLNGTFVRKGLTGARNVYSPVGVSHTRPLAAFTGQSTAIEQFPKALTAEEIAKLAATKPAAATGGANPVLDPVKLEFLLPGNYQIRYAGGATTSHQLDLPAPAAINGPWALTFPAGRGAPAHVSLEQLGSWSEHPDPGVKYFSGTASYRKSFELPPLPTAPAGIRHALTLDLGKVAVMARVILNGRDLGTLWKPPYQVDVTGAARPGTNELELQVVNLPVNRMIGDEQLPEDSARQTNGTLQQWPQWLLEGKPSPAGRFTFTSWRLWNKDSPLQESGLLGPVTVTTSARLARP